MPALGPRKVRGSLTVKVRAMEALRRLKAANPDPRCELYYETPFQLLVSVVLSAQTTDKAVNRCMEPLYKQGFTVATIVDLGEMLLYEKIKTIGLARTKARNLFKLAGMVRDIHGGDVPSSRTELEALPGVGRKTASVVLGELFSQPTIAVDTHVARVTGRLGLHELANPTKIELRLLQIIEPSFLPAAHHWFILHGRYTCTARKPKCEGCPLADLCPSFQK